MFHSEQSDSIVYNCLSIFIFCYVLVIFIMFILINVSKNKKDAVFF